jgi:signal transduction histidine kinase
LPSYKAALRAVRSRFGGAPKGQIYLVALHGVTVALVGLGMENLLRAVDQPGRELIKVGCSLVLGVVSVAVIQYTYKRDVEHFETIAGVGAVFCVYGSCIAGLVALAHTLGTEVAMDWSYTVAMGGLAGIVAGIPVGSVYTSFGRVRIAGQDREMQLRSVSSRISILYRVARHNIRTETNIILGYLDLLESADRSGVAEEHMRVLRKHATRLGSISKQVKRLRLIWENEGSTVDTPTAALVEKALAPFRADRDAIDVGPIGDATVRCHPFAHWAIEEAVDNALTHNDDGTTVTVRTADANGRVRVIVEDDGSGIPPLEVESLQRPTESQLVHGQGLGLQVIYWATESAGGSLAIEDRERGGTRVILEFPSA